MAMLVHHEEVQATTTKLISQGEKTQRLSQDVLAAVPAEVYKGAKEGVREVVKEATVVAVNRVRLEQEKKAELQKETQKAENDRCQQRRDPGRGR